MDVSTRGFSRNPRALKAGETRSRKSFRRTGFGKDQSSGMTVDPNVLITLRKQTHKINGASRGGMFFLTEHGVSSTTLYNIKELKGKLDHIMDAPPPQAKDDKASAAAADVDASPREDAAETSSSSS